jgi:hypothetical protein
VREGVGFSANFKLSYGFTPKISRRSGNFGLGMGLTGVTDHLIAKMILGYRFNS